MSLPWLNKVLLLLLTTYSDERGVVSLKTFHNVSQLSIIFCVDDVISASYFSIFHTGILTMLSPPSATGCTLSFPMHCSLDVEVL